MKTNKILVVLLGLTCAASQAYFWNDWSRRGQTQDNIEKRNIDLKYQEKNVRVEQKKADAAADARKKQVNLDYKQSELELKRKREKLNADRY